MGWQTFHCFANEDKNLIGLPSSSVYFRLYWSEIEPEEGQIDFVCFDDLLSRARKAGQKLALRIMCAGTNKEFMYVPLWLEEKGCRGFEYRYQKSGPRYWIPDMDDPLFQEAHFRLIRNLGQRYNGHPDLDIIDIGSVGLWGEWNMGQADLRLPSLETRLAIIDAYCEAFSRSLKVMLIGDKEGMKYAILKGCGWRADCLGDMGGFSKSWNHMDHFYPQQIKETRAEEAWKTGPVAFESCWDMRRWQKEGWDIRYIFDYALDYHVTYFNNMSAQIPEGTKEEIERFLLKMGYRLVLRKIEHDPSVSLGSNLSVSMLWENIGVAPPYRDYRLAFRLTGVDRKVALIVMSDISIQGWLPGQREVWEMMKMPENISPGQYDLDLAVVDPVTQIPAVRLAIKGQEAGGWFSISQVEVKNTD